MKSNDVKSNDLSTCVYLSAQSYVATDRVEKKISPDELMRYAKPITTATAKAVAAGNSGRQDDVIAAANMGRKAVFDLLHACKVSLALVLNSPVDCAVWQLFLAEKCQM